MSITLALVGRTNVGKSTVFNYLTHTQSALTANVSGVTRDRRYGSFSYGEQLYTLIDTGGLDVFEDIFANDIKQQVQYALEQTDCIGFVIDARRGLAEQDRHIARFLRSFNKPIRCIINKVEGRLAEEQAIAEFAPLGFEPLYLVSALQGKGFTPLIESLLTFQQKAEYSGGSGR
jgi:GTPase